MLNLSFRQILSELHWQLVLLLAVGLWLLGRSLKLDGKRALSVKILGKRVLLLEVGQLDENLKEEVARVLGLLAKEKTPQQEE
jgi:hypothetical protein